VERRCRTAAASLGSPRRSRRSARPLWPAPPGVTGSVWTVRPVGRGRRLRSAPGVPRARRGDRAPAHATSLPEARARSRRRGLPHREQGSRAAGWARPARRRGRAERRRSCRQRRALRGRAATLKGRTGVPTQPSLRRPPRALQGQGVARLQALRWSGHGHHASVGAFAARGGGFRPAPPRSAAGRDRDSRRRRPRPAGASADPAAPSPGAGPPTQLPAPSRAENRARTGAGPPALPRA
jgi:hypothetical protein